MLASPVSIGVRPICPELHGGFRAICLYMIPGKSGWRGDGGAKWPGCSDKCDRCKSDSGQAARCDGYKV